METLTSRRDLFLQVISGFFISLLFVASSFAQQKKTSILPTNQVSIINQRERLAIVNQIGQNLFEPIGESTKVNVFASLKPTALEAQAFLLINEIRATKNLKPLELDSGMLYIARAHSAEMAEFNYFSHKGRDGSMADRRAIKAGIIDWQGIGENIAFSQNASDKVQLAVEGWMNSARHRENLLNPTWAKSGIGIAVTSDHKFYITQVFRE